MSHTYIFLSRFHVGLELMTLRLQAAASTDWASQATPHIIFFSFKDFIHLTMEAQWEREAETQSEGEAGSMQGAWYGTQSRVSKITPWAEGGAKRWAPPAAQD